MHLVFLGVERPGATGRHPDERGGGDRLRARARARGQCVHFNHGWVPYEERQSYLLEADFGISAHHDHLEARFSFRTRVLDYLWAGLPMVLTRGDSMADLAERQRPGRHGGRRGRRGLRRSVRGAARRRASGETAAAARARGAPSRSAGSEAARPLVEFCLDHRERPCRAVTRTAIALATYGQYPAILADVVVAEGPRGVAPSDRSQCRASAAARRIAHDRRSSTTMSWWSLSPRSM